MTRHIVAEHDDDIGIKRVGVFHDPLDMHRRHPGIARVKIRDDRNLELETRRPLRRHNVVTGHAEPHQRLDAETIGHRRGAECTKAGDEAKEVTA